jgi:hypothetical protein
MLMPFFEFLWKKVKKSEKSWQIGQKSGFFVPRE